MYLIREFLFFYWQLFVIEYKLVPTPGYRIQIGTFPWLSNKNCYLPLVIEYKLVPTPGYRIQIATYPWLSNTNWYLPLVIEYKLVPSPGY